MLASLRMVGRTIDRLRRGCDLESERRCCFGGRAGELSGGQGEHVLLRWRKRRTAPTDVVVHDPADEQQAEPQTHPIEEWRRSAQRVTRAWNAWLAADRHDRDSCYRAVVAALAEEERAALEMERVTQQHEDGKCARLIPR